MSDAKGLKSYLKTASETEAECLRQNADFVSIIVELEALFASLVEGEAHGKILAHLLAVNAHAQFLVAVQTALRGQSPGTFMLLRGALESAMYAYIASLSDEDAEAWGNREKDPQKAKALFTANRAIQKLQGDDADLAAVAREAYEWMIEFGAHPNKRVVFDHLRFKEETTEGHIPVSFIYIHSADSLATVRALMACLENCCLVIAIICKALPEHPMVVGMAEKIAQHFNAASQVAKEKGFLGEDDEDDVSEPETKE
jgi:hypothetical protein